MEEHIQHIIPEYLSGELTDAEIEKAEKHFEECPACASEVKEIKDIFNILECLEDEEPSDLIFEKVIEDITPSMLPEIQPEEKPFAVRLIIGFLIVAAAAGFVFIINLLVSSIPVWEEVKKISILGSLGSLGVSICIVIGAGAFLSLSIMPVIFMEKLRGKNI